MLGGPPSPSCTFNPVARQFLARYLLPPPTDASSATPASLPPFTRFPLFCSPLCTVLTSRQIPLRFASSAFVLQGVNLFSPPPAFSDLSRNPRASATCLREGGKGGGGCSSYPQMPTLGLRSCATFVLFLRDNGTARLRRGSCANHRPVVQVLSGRHAFCRAFMA